MSRDLWLVRHAETAWSAAKRHTGRTDVPLTDGGREATRGLGGPTGALGAREFALVLSSPLSRAHETAQLAGFGDVVQLRDDLLEFDYGDYEGITTAEIRRTRPDWLLWRDGCPNGETAEDVGTRADRVIAEALDTDGDVALFAHGHVLRALAARWLVQPAAFGARLALDTGAVCVLGFERETRVIWHWNAQ